MKNNAKTAVQYAFRLLLSPIASMALKCGMTWKEFADLSKSVFVQAATDEYGINGRPTNTSRVSLLTGISRKEVKRQRDLLMHEAAVKPGKTTDATRVLSGWFQDPVYLDAKAIPRPISERGPAPSFETLCHRYGGDIPMRAMLKELLKTRAVERRSDDLLGVISRFYQPAMHDDENLRWAASLISDLGATMNNNVFLDGTRLPRFGRKADNERIPRSAIPEFREHLADRGQAFLEDIDDWLTDHVTSDVAAATECVRIGVGMFAIEDLENEEKIA